MKRLTCPDCGGHSLWPITEWNGFLHQEEFTGVECLDCYTEFSLRNVE